jgi:hypothetical protein
LPGELFKQRITKAKAHRKIDFAGLVVNRVEQPDIVEIAHRPVDIMNLNPLGPYFFNPRCEFLAQILEPDQHVGDHFVLAVGSYPGGSNPRQEFGIVTDIGDQIKHLLGAVRHRAKLTNLRH